MQIGAINPNVFQDRDYAFGSITNEDPAVRKKAVDHMLDSIEIGKKLGSDVLSLWFADGTDYPGQGDFRRRKHYAEECLKTVYNAMPAEHADADRVQAVRAGVLPHRHRRLGHELRRSAQKCGPNAHVLVDLGHHFTGQNIEHIVAFLIDEERLGGFHFNNHKYADDDLTVGSINPYELFLIYNELVKAEDAPNGNPPIAYMVDQAHVTKSKIDAMIQTIMHIQTRLRQGAVHRPQEALRGAAGAGHRDGGDLPAGGVQHRCRAAAEGRPRGDGPRPEPARGVPRQRLLGRRSARSEGSGRGRAGVGA